MANVSVRIQEHPFDIGKEVADFTAACGDAGAVVTFTGVVRDVSGGLKHMEIEHYPAMTARAIEDIECSAIDKWNLSASLVIHRYGQLEPGEIIMMVATASRHRAEAFMAAQYLMDFLKSRAPFWKKEVTTSGAEWVESRNVDEQALKRWTD